MADTPPPLTDDEIREALAVACDCEARPCRAARRALRDLLACRERVKELERVITERFSYEPTMRSEGCDTIGHELVPMSKETRLTIISTIREAKARAALGDTDGD